MTSFVPGARLGRYELLSRIGMGGMAEVWLARQRGFGGVERLVALKRILPRYGADPHFVERFAAEAHLAAALSHVHIATIYDLEEVGGELLIAMELVRGETLQAAIRRAWELTGAPIPPALAVGIAARVGRALHHAHTLGDPSGRALGMVHRDLSPSNVLIGYRGEVKLVDFGIARALTASTAGAGGKVAYMSPEQARGDEIDPRSDVFAAGVVLWELLTGMRLFGGMDAAQTRAAVCAPEPARAAAEARPGLAPALAAIVSRALAKDPRARYESAAQWVTALEDYGRAAGDPASDEAIAALMQRLFQDRVEHWSALVDAGGDARPLARAAPPAPSPAASSSPVAERPAPPPPPAPPLPAPTAYAPIARPLPPLHAPLELPPIAPPAPPLPAPTAYAPIAPPPIAPPATAAAVVHDLFADFEDAVPAADATDPDEGRPAAFPDSLIARLDALDRAQQPGPDSLIARLDALDRAQQPGPTAHTAAEDLDAFSPALALAPTQPAVPRPPAPTPTDAGPSPTPTPPAPDDLPASAAALAPSPTERPSQSPVDDGFEPDPFAEDDDDERGPLVSFLEVLDAASPAPLDEVHRPGARRPLAAEVIELAPGGGMADTAVVFRAAGQAQTRESVARGALRITVRDRDALIEAPAGGARVDGDAQIPLAAGHTVAFGDTATIAIDGTLYRVRVFVPPPRPPRALREVKWAVYFAAIVLVAGVHLSSAPMFGMLREMGVTATVVVDAPERFADGEMARKPKPKPEPRVVPKPKPKAEVKPVRKPAPHEVSPVIASVEAPPQVPKKVRERLDAERSHARVANNASPKDELLQRLQAPTHGGAKTLAELETNIEARDAGRVSDVNRVTGIVGSLPGGVPAYARDGGTEAIGPLAGDAADAIGKKLALAPEKRSGPVRGKVTGMKAATKVTGELDPGQVYAVIDANIAMIQACYERRLQADPSLAGRITFRWTVTPTGSVTAVKQHVSTVSDPKVASCIKGVLERLRFPKPRGGSVEISYPFIFRSS